MELSRAIEVGSYKNAESYATQASREGVGFRVLLVALWLVFDYGRPSNPLHIPMVISALLFLAWIFHPHKKWNVQICCFLIFLGVMLIDIPLAANNHEAFWSTYGMAVVLLTAVIPLIHVVDSLRKLAFLINTWMVVFLYVGVWAIFHEGWGPALDMGHDENYVGTLMTMALPFAFFYLFFESGLIRKALLVVFCVSYLGAIVVGLSRGAFLGLCFVFLYCLKHSPRKWIGWTVGFVLVLALSFFATEKYWNEVSSIKDTDRGSASDRLDFWEIATREFLHYPLTGVGPGNFTWRAGEFQSAEQLLRWGHSLEGNYVAHSLYFELLADLGLAGAILFLVILYQNYKDLKLVKQVIKRARDRLNKEIVVLPDEQKALRLEDLARADCYRNALTGSLIGCLVPSAFLSTLYFSYFWVLTGMIVALREICLTKWMHPNEKDNQFIPASLHEKFNQVKPIP